MNRNVRILIAGAGPTGLTAAFELARRGFTPRIVDRDPGPTPLSKAVGISPHSLDLLDVSGVTERLLADGIRIRHAQVRSGADLIGEIDLSALRHRFNFLLSLPQSETETIMADVLAASGIPVEWNTEVTGLAMADRTAEVMLAGPNGAERATFDLVFGADGVHSKVRDAAGLPFEGFVHKRTWSIADVEVADWPYERNAAELFFCGGGDLGFVIPIGPDRLRAVSNTPEAMERVPGSYRVVRLLRTDRFHIPIKQAARYQAGCAFLGGDAAHVHSPVGARGMNLGIEDAACFARRLAEDALDGYTDERHPVGRRWIRLSERILGMAQASNPLTASLRNIAFRAVAHLPSLQRPILERATGIRE